MRYDTPVDDSAKPTDRLEDPAALCERADVRVTRETIPVDGRDHRSIGTGGQAVVGVTNGDGPLLTLLEDERSIALLPHAAVEPGGDWATAARRGVENQTGMAVSLEAVEAVRVVEYVVDGIARATNHRVVYRGSPAGGAIRVCKRSADAGSDGWRATWIDALPDGVAPPGVGPADDIGLFLEG